MNTIPSSHSPSALPDKKALFSRLAASMARHRGVVILVWLVVTLAAAPLAISLTKALSGAGWDAKGSTAEKVRLELRKDFPALGAENPVVVVQQSKPFAQDPTAINELVKSLAEGPHVTGVVNPLSMPAEAGMVSQDGKTALIPVAQEINDEA